MVYAYVQRFNKIRRMNVVMQVDPVLDQALTSLRANRMRTFIKVIIPLSTPDILAGLSLAVSTFVTPQLVGGPHAKMVGGFVYIRS